MASASGEPSTAGLVVVDLDDSGASSSWRDLVVVAAAAEAGKRMGTGTTRTNAGAGAARLWVYFRGGCAGGTTTNATLELLTLCYDSIATTAPCLDVVPALQSVGWQPADVARAMPSETALYVAPSSASGVVGAGAGVTIDAIRRSREELGLPPLVTTPVTIDVAAEARTRTDAKGRASEGGGSEGTPLRFTKVSVGGTFDRMHAGHRLLLAAASAVAGAPPATIYLGVTGDELLVSKAHRDLIQTYETRANAARAFLESTRPSVADSTAEAEGDVARVCVRVGPLDNSPPLAATVEAMEALVISRETVAGGEALNALRAEAGFRPITLAVVGLVGGSGDGDGDKLSSTALRGEEATSRS